MVWRYRIFQNSGRNSREFTGNLKKCRPPLIHDGRERLLAGGNQDVCQVTNKIADIEFDNENYKIGNVTLGGVGRAYPSNGYAW
jgi:hypothetical protein